MAKCGMRDCTEKVIGGFQSTIAAGTFENPEATIPGMQTFWCKTHESGLKQGLGRGRHLSGEELK
jgi:hypothetical protein